MISSIEWVPMGVADPSPKKYELSAAEQELIQMMESQGLTEGDGDEEQKLGLSEEEEEEDEEENTPTKKNKKKEETHHGLPADLRMDEYSSDEDENDDAVKGVALGSLLMEKAEENTEKDPEKSEKDADDDDEKMDSDGSDDDDDDDDFDDIPDTREFEPINVEGLESMGFSQVGSNAPMYMDGEEEVNDDDSDVDDVRITENDALVVVAKTEEDFAALEVHVYEQHTGNLFVHHDVPLPAFPLCLAHGDIGPTGSAGNFCAVGMFTPGIEIWNLDVLNALEPSCILGGVDTSMADELMAHKLGVGSGGSNKKKKKKKKALEGPQLRAGSHTDAVMALSWNKIHRQVIASGSADCTVKIWDVTHANSGKANERTFSHHRDKVQSVMWHPTEGTLLATGSYDRTVALVDARGSGEDIKRVKIPSDCETLAWDPFNPQYLTAASEDGTITCWDVRKFSDSSPLWSFVANEYGGVSDLSYNPHVPGMLATCAIDKTVTLWDTHQENANMPPRVCGNKDMKVGKLYTVSFYPSSPWLLGCGGGGKELALWDMSQEEAIQSRFGSRCTSKTVGNPVQLPDNGVKEVDFEATMASSEPAAEEADKKTSSSKKKKDRNKKKKKVHRAGR